MNKLSLTLALVAMSLASPVFAWENPAGFKVDWSHCEKEINKWCKDSIAKGEEDVYKCLEKHDADLSKDCDNGSHSKYEQATGKSK